MQRKPHRKFFKMVLLGALLGAGTSAYADIGPITVGAGTGGISFTVPCATVNFIPYNCSAPSVPNPGITDLCKCTIE